MDGMMGASVVVGSHVGSGSGIARVFEGGLEGRHRSGGQGRGGGSGRLKGLEGLGSLGDLGVVF